MSTSHQRGVTLIELVITIVVASLVLGGLVVSFGRLMEHSADPLVMRQSLSLAHAMMEEIRSKPLVDPSTHHVCGPVPAERRLFDSVCDYTGYRSVVMSDIEGRRYDVFAGFSVAVSITPTSWGGLPAGVAWKAEVSIDNPLQRPVVLASYFTCREGPDVCHPE